MNAKKLILPILLLMFGQAYTYACGCSEEKNFENALIRFNLVVKGKVVKVQEISQNNQDSLVFRFKRISILVDSLFKGRGGDTISFDYRPGITSCNLISRNFEIGKSYVIGTHRSMHGVYKPLEKRKNPLYPNDHNQSGKVYPEIYDCSFVEEIP